MQEIQADWREVRRSAFNERSNPDDNELGIQIVKDLHRTGCSTFSGLDNDQERAVLKRVLLGYARWNKEIGYCQGFNIIAALILDVVDRKEEEALKIMIFLVDKVLPASYFSNNLRALSVDMAVFRDLMHSYLPRLSGHLRELQIKAQQDLRSGGYEPPLTNVFTMQWFLTLFATCLPLRAVLRIWDAIMIEGSEVIIRTALALWGILQKRLLRKVDSADDFYTEMGKLLQSIMDQESDMVDIDGLLQHVYSFAPFPFPQLNQLRDNYTYNITPIALTEAVGDTMPKKKAFRRHSDNAGPDFEAMNDLTTAVDADKSLRSASLDIEGIGPGTFGADTGSAPGEFPPGVSSEGGVIMEERTCTDVSKLQKKYEVIRRRQSQAKIMMHKSNFDNGDMGKQQRPVSRKVTNLVIPPAPKLHRAKGYEISSSNAVNHLYVKPDEWAKCERKNRHVVPFGTTLFASEPEKNPSISPVRYAGAFFLSESQFGTTDGQTDGQSDGSALNKIFYNDDDEDSMTLDNEDGRKRDGNNNREDDKSDEEDISKTLLQLHIEWKDKHSTSDDASESSDSKRNATTITPKNPFSTQSPPKGIGSFTTDDIRRSDKLVAKDLQAKRQNAEKAGKAVQPPTQTVKKDQFPVRPNRPHIQQHVRRERREFGIKLGIYKASDFASKPAPVRPMLSHGEGLSERITRQQINNCLTRESLASSTWELQHSED